MLNWDKKEGKVLDICGMWINFAITNHLIVKGYKQTSAAES